MGEKLGRLKIKDTFMLRDLGSRKFTMYIGTKTYHNRTIDKQGRIWVGMKALQDFSVGEKIIVELRGEELYITKKA